MNVCIIGDGLISLTLAKTLINKKIKVFMYCENKKKKHYENGTIGISSNNINFIKKNILEIKPKYICNISEIEIYNYKNEKILNFNNKKKNLFSVIKNNDFYNLLEKSLKKNINFKKIKTKKNFYNQILKNEKYDLIFNCDSSNILSKNYFFNKFSKNYNSTAHVSIITHNKLENQKAIQIFTKYGPLAFLPLSQSKTSVIFSIKNNSIKLNDKILKNLIIKNAKKYKIKSFENFENFKLNLKTLKKYYYKNILAFGDLLHQLHPLAGQGFNMTLRDIKILLDFINNKKSLGLPIDYSIYEEFQNATKHKNFLFASGNDFIYEFFNYDNFYSKSFSNKIFNYLNKNHLFNNLALKYADEGLSI
tara:strand:- start:384 stop:1472 length:1089 start_codon:yes stop_codon:yes gene_type:complete